MGLLRTDASDPHLDLGGSVMMDNQLTDADAWRSRQTSGLMPVDHEQLRDESKQSKALDDDDKLPTTYQVSDPRAGPTVPSYNPIPPIVPSYKPTSWGFQNHCNLLQAMGPPDGEYDLGSFSDEESDVDMYCKVYEFSDGSVDDGNEKLPTTYQPDALGYQTSNNLTHAGYDGFRANASSFFNNPRSFTEEETKTYNKIVQETDGFGSIYVPPGVSTPGLLMPAKIEFVGKEGSMMLDGLAELAVVRYNEDNETSYQVVKIIRVNFRFDGWMFYNMTFQARDDKAGSLPRNFQARIRRFGNQTKVDFCRFEEEPKPIQGLNIPGLLSPILLENIHPNTKEILIEMAKLAIQYFNKGNVKSYTFLKLSKVNSRLVPHLVARGLDRALYYMTFEATVDMVGSP